MLSFIYIARHYINADFLFLIYMLQQSQTGQFRTFVLDTTPYCKMHC